MADPTQANSKVLLAELQTEAHEKQPADKFTKTAWTNNEFVFAGILVALLTLVAYFIQPFTGYLSIALIYLLLVVAVGLKLSRGPILTVAATSALLWNFLFIPPHFTLYIDKVHDAMMFAMFDFFWHQHKTVKIIRYY